jgi:hypothetical protein
MTKAPSELDAIADTLYRLKPDEFTSARNTKASDARAAGDRATAKAIKELRRPSTSAWLANWLVHERPEEFGRLQSLGSSLRDASERLAGDELRRLSRQRHEVLAALTAEARGAADEAGIPFSSAVSSELEATLMATLSDEEAAAALQEGRLTTALRYTGFGSSGTAPAVIPSRKSRAERPSAEHKRALEKVRPSAEHKRALEKAERVLAAARKESGKQEHLADEARGRRDDLRRAVHDLEAQLEELTGEEAKATDEASVADESRRLAEQAVTIAEQQVDEARRRLDSVAK